MISSSHGHVVKTALSRTYDSLVSVLPEEWRVRFLYLKSFRTFPDLRSPKTFSEKIQHRKLFDTDARLSRYADKVLVKEHVRSLLGDDMLIPTLFSGPFLPPMEERTWPLPFVIKANHGCAMNIFVRKQNELDWPVIERELCRFLSIDWGKISVERFYSKIKRQILVEPFLSFDGNFPWEYKIFVFDGQPRFVLVVTDPKRDEKEVFYDVGWQRMKLRRDRKLELREIPKPVCFERMLSAASILGATFGFVRVDFYECNGKPYFNEMTFTPSSGLSRFYPPETDRRLGDMWTLGWKKEARESFS